MRVLIVTSEWPSAEFPSAGSFVVQQVDFLRRAGVDVDVFDFRGGKDPRNYFSARRRVAERLRSDPYDLVHAQFGQSGVTVIPSALPLVVTFHGGGDLHGLPYEGTALSVFGWFLRAVSRSVARRADEVIVQSEALAQHLPDGVPYHVIPCGVDLDLFRPEPKAQARAALGLPADERLVLFSGNPRVGFKRYALAQRTVELLPSERRARLMTVSGMNRSDVARFMNACDVLLVTAAYEAGPVMVKEALACNLPVVGLGVGDVPERIRDLDGCVLCPDDRPETIATAIAEVLGCTEPFDGRASVGDVEESVLVGRLIDVYRRAVARRR